jgi:HK97 family phage portal protein
MSFLDTLSGILRMEPAPPFEVTQTRAAAPFEVNIPGLFGLSSMPYRMPSVRGALGVPAVLRAVTLIANTAGALSMTGIREGVRVPATERPRLIVRPNPLTTPGAFWRDTAFWKALYGETWWWVAKRDTDDLPMSLVNVPPYEVKVEEDPADLRYPIVRWRDRRMARGDMIQMMLTPDPSNPRRGVGPLQLCGAAISVAVESQEWAANFYAEGGFPSVYLKSDYHFEDEDEPTKIKQKWTATPSNTPHVLSPGLEPGTLPVNTEGAQMLGARVHNNGEVALMFGIPGSLLEYVQSGSSLTYQNVGQRFDDFVKGCLWPNYLEGTEQAMTDLLPRTWVAEFDTDRFTRPDPKTRMEIHQIAIGAGVYDAEYAQVQEGILPGSIETAPIPPSPPAAIPPPIETRTAAEPVEVRCDGLRPYRGRLVACGKLLAESAVPPYRFTCSRCKAVAEAVAA